MLSEGGIRVPLILRWRKATRWTGILNANQRYGSHRYNCYGCVLKPAQPNSLMESI